MGNGLELFLCAKALGWLVTEPGALGWTYLTMRTFCPVLLPEQGLEVEEGDFSGESIAWEKSAVWPEPGIASDDSSPGSLCTNRTDSSLQAHLLAPVNSSASGRQQRAASTPV